MAPINPHWPQPSHPSLQEVIISSGTNADEYTTKSISRVTLPPFAVFAKLSFPPCSVAPEPTYATVQMGRDAHLSLNSDLLYINHSCDPSLIFDTSSFNVLVGPKGLKPGDELTFFYPSTEWHMAQPFQCHCATPLCRGTISGARDMTPSQLEGYFLNAHIRSLIEERDNQQQQQQQQQQQGQSDPTALALQNVLRSAEKSLDSARAALQTYLGGVDGAAGTTTTAKAKANGAGDNKASMGNGVGTRSGPTSRELSGEMDGDTRVQV
ncbi:Histone-lysine N-methyltransferase-like protein [Hapsidospora chrysogenum ATCC 11550]|uniref:Histone-lysine N-methyltransferase-like protein n=1 Tax=Hapsidospora chrysogenum (strain ATCC 11550 / CBS 779.69 / DSM 880 / IAM 14645 / JCM 23072 / IMI 49137) TaxID=857340 RepID=A0A086T273_HAPC1|nr:Histone-lysine N-methyltransferase-like protein [Hapsidospora chrysogenum ATCC 11550]